MVEVLEGIRIIETAGVLATPQGGAVLADFDVDVIKIEHARKPNRSRGKGVAMRMIQQDTDSNHLFGHTNNNKHSIGIDLGTEVEREIVYKLWQKLDILLSNL